MLDVLIRGGVVVDGTGNLGFQADVGVDGDKVKLLRGNTSSVAARTIVDACNCVVCPGFIDVHTHSDLLALAEPKNEPKVRQGVTTEILGQDGLGYAPLSKKNLDLMLRHYAGLGGFPSLDYGWRTVADYLGRFEKTTSLNMAYLIPNSCIRAEAIGWRDQRASAEQIAQMQDMIRQGMSEGAVGMSTGLSYPPGVYADTEELVELCRTVARCGGVYVTHVRYDLGDGAFDPFREAIAIGRRSGCPVHLSHYATNLATRGQPERLLALVDEARTAGVEVTFDSYPWPAGSSVLHTVVPLWAHDGGPDELLACLRNRKERERMRGQSTRIVGLLEKTVVSAVKTDKNTWAEGETIATVAERLHKDPWDAICDLLIEEDLQVAFYAFTGDMNDVKTILQHPAHMFCSDGLRIGGRPNPRTYGTYPKVLGQLVRDEKVLSLEEAVRKMTSFPAQRFGLTDRGILRDGMKADIVAFDPLTVSSVATFEEPKRFPLGIEYVFVNGQMVVEKGRHTGATPGEAIKMGARC